MLDHEVLVGKDGKLPDWFTEKTAAYASFYADKPLWVRMGKPTRSTGQNSFYWSQRITPITNALREAGASITAQQVHEHYRNHLLNPEIIDIEGVQIVKRPTTTTLDTTAFSRYIKAIELDELTLRLGLVFEEEPKYPTTQT